MLYFNLLIVLSVSYVNGGPPVFIQQPYDAIVTDERLVFNCTAGADVAPPPVVSWYRGNPPLLLSAFRGLSILNISSAVDGVDASTGGIQYYCTASNGYGTIRSKTVTAFIAVFGGFQNERNATLNVENATLQSYLDTVALNCNVSGANPLSSIVWVNDLGQVVPNNGVTYVYVEEGRYLVIRNVNATLAQRTFHCRVINALGSKTVDSRSLYKFNASGYSSTQLTIYKPLKDVTAYEGDTNVKFSLVAASLGTTSISCSISSTPISSSLPVGTQLNTQSSVLAVIPGPVSVRDSGTGVVCYVNYGLPIMVAQYTATLTVLASPALTSSPSNSLYNFQGDTASFTCGYFAAPGITLSWYKDGVQLNSSSSRVQISGSSLNIPSLFLNDSGMYQCSVSNGTNSIWAQWAVGVRAPKLALISQGQSTPLVVSTGSNVTLTFQVQADPAPSVQWFFNGSLIQSNITYQSSITPANNIAGSILYNVSLLIDSVDLTTQGYYYASFSNRAGTQNISSVFVTPPAPAQVLGIATPTCLTPGTTLQVQCVTYGYPVPLIQFAINNFAVLSSNGRISVFNNYLVIGSATLNDEGLYCCYVSSGQMTGTAALSCSSIPTCGYPVVAIGASASIALGNPVNLTCNDEGNLQSTFSWTKDGQSVVQDSHLNIVTAGSHSTLTFSELRSEDKGLYTCTATNPLGSSTHTYPLSFNSLNEILPSYGTIIFIVAVIVLFILVPLVGVLCYFNGRRKSSHYNLEAVADHNPHGTTVTYNVDKRSSTGEPPEAFSPQYDSLPVSEVRPPEPPSYVPTPAYEVKGRDHVEMEMMQQSSKLVQDSTDGSVDEPLPHVHYSRTDGSVDEQLPPVHYSRTDGSVDEQLPHRHQSSVPSTNPLCPAPILCAQHQSSVPSTNPLCPAAPILCAQHQSSVPSTNPLCPAAPILCAQQHQSSVPSSTNPLCPAAPILCAQHQSSVPSTNPLCPAPILCAQHQSSVPSGTNPLCPAAPILCAQQHQSSVPSTNPLCPAPILCAQHQSSVPSTNPLCPAPILCAQHQSSVPSTNPLCPAAPILCAQQHQSSVPSTNPLCPAAPILCAQQE
ncbi:hypothetical protein EMCRGX_G015825 [Ephydatia muelleri]